jgi:hypothetical protein
MPNITISTTIKDTIYKEIKDKNLKFNQLIYKGLQANGGFPYLTERQNTLEANNAELRIANEKLYLIIQKMRREIDAMFANMEKQPGDKHE